MSYIFQQVFTWYDVLSYSGVIVPLGFLALYIGAGIYALYKPLYGGLMNLFMPIFVSFYIGSATFGIGFYLQLTAAIGQIILGIWKKQIRKKLLEELKV